MTYITVVPNHARRFEIVTISDDGTTAHHDRDYGRLDSAVAKAWTLANRHGLPLRIDITPGAPVAGVAAPAPVA